MLEISLRFPELPEKGEHVASERDLISLWCSLRRTASNMRVAWRRISLVSESSWFIRALISLDNDSRFSSSFRCSFIEAVCRLDVRPLDTAAELEFFGQLTAASWRSMFLCQWFTAQSCHNESRKTPHHCYQDYVTINTTNKITCSIRRLMPYYVQNYISLY